MNKFNKVDIAGQGSLIDQLSKNIKRVADESLERENVKNQEYKAKFSMLDRNIKRDND